MRQIEKEMRAAFEAGREMRKSNTSVLVYMGGVWVYLHGNLIAFRDMETGERSFSCAGWHTVTTASRLRALGAPAQIRGGRMINAETGEPFPCSI